MECAISTAFSCCRLARDYIRSHPVFSSSNLNIHPHHHHRRRLKKACSGSTRATSPLTRTTATRAELGRPCSQRSRRRARVDFYISSRSGTRNLKLEGGLQIWHALSKRWLSSVRGQNEHTERSKDRRRKYDPALHMCRTQAA